MLLKKQLQTLVQEAGILTAHATRVPEELGIAEANRWIAGVFQSFIIVGPTANIVWYNFGLEFMSMEELTMVGAKELPGGDLFQGLWTLAYHDAIWEKLRGISCSKAPSLS